MAARSGRCEDSSSRAPSTQGGGEVSHGDVAVASEALRDLAAGLVEHSGQFGAASETRRGYLVCLTSHALRHTYASNLIAAGCDVVTVQRALGHSQQSIVLNTHRHWWPSRGQDESRHDPFYGKVG